MTPHVSDFAIARLIEGELSGADASTIRAHTLVCSRCEAMYLDAVTIKDKFPSLARPLPAPRRTRFMATGVALAVAAAACVAIALWPGGNPTTTRTKGRAVLGFFVEHDGVIRRGASGEHVRPGDRIEMFTTTSEPGWLAVTSNDGAGVHTVYVMPRAIEAGVEQIIPQAVVLDATLGDEVIEGVFCPSSFEVPTPPLDCARDRFTIHKDAP